MESSTKILRRMLDERGVEWWDDSSIYGTRRTVWKVGGVVFVAAEVSGRLKVSGYLTPEQAIAATLGPRKQPPYDELIEALRRDWDIEASWDGLRRFWYVGLTDEGVRKRDEREATLGRGTCKPREVRSRFSKTQEYVTYHCECGHELGGYMTAELPFPHTYNEDELPNFCPNCGRRIVEVSE